MPSGTYHTGGDEGVYLLSAGPGDDGPRAIRSAAAVGGKGAQFLDDSAQAESKYTSFFNDSKILAFSCFFTGTGRIAVCLLDNSSDLLDC